MRKVLINLFIFLFLISFSLWVPGFVRASEDPSEWKKPEYAIHVRLYRGGPVGNFLALEELGKILVQETSRGFLIRSVVNRDSFHPGATFCLQVDPLLFDVKEELTRILARIRSLKPEGSFIDFQVTNPSTCMLEFFPKEHKGSDPNAQIK